MNEVKTYKQSIGTRDTEGRIPAVTSSVATDTRKRSPLTKKPAATNEATTIPSDNSVTTAQAADMLNVHIRTVRGYITEGFHLKNGEMLYLPAQQVRSLRGKDQYHIDRKDIENFQAARKVQATKGATSAQLKQQATRETIPTKHIKKMVEEKAPAQHMKKVAEEKNPTQLIQDEGDLDRQYGQDMVLAALQTVEALSEDNRILITEIQASNERIIMKFLDRIGGPEIKDVSLLQSQTDPEVSIKQENREVIQKRSRFLLPRS